MRVTTAVAVPSLLLLLFLSGCWIAPSLHPLYTEDRSQVVFDQALLGTWKESPSEGEDAGAGSWTFEAGEQKAYKLTVLFENRPSKMQAVLVKLGDELFLDLCPDELTEEQQNCIPLFWIMHVIPVHSFAHVQLDGDSLSLAFLDPDWVLEQAKQGKLDIRTEVVAEDAFVLTASPRELQAFLLNAVKTEGAFGDPGVMSRVK